MWYALLFAIVGIRCLSVGDGYPVVIGAATIASYSYFHWRLDLRWDVRMKIVPNVLTMLYGARPWPSSWQQQRHDLLQHFKALKSAEENTLRKFYYSKVCKEISLIAK